MARSVLPWFVYLIHSESTGHLYVGVTTDPTRRLAEHNGKGKRGARYTRKGRPWIRLYLESAIDRVAAMKREYAIKRFHRPKKFALVDSPTNINEAFLKSRLPASPTPENEPPEPSPPRDHPPAGEAAPGTASSTSAPP